MHKSNLLSLCVCVCVFMFREKKVVYINLIHTTVCCFMSALYLFRPEVDEVQASFVETQYLGRIWCWVVCLYKYHLQLSLWILVHPLSFAQVTQVQLNASMFSTILIMISSKMVTAATITTTFHL